MIKHTGRLTQLQAEEYGITWRYIMIIEEGNGRLHPVNINETVHDVLLSRINEDLVVNWMTDNDEIYNVHVPLYNGDTLIIYIKNKNIDGYSFIFNRS